MSRYVGVSEWLDIDDDSIAIGLADCSDPMVVIPLELLLDAQVTRGDLGGELTMVIDGADLLAGALHKTQTITIKFAETDATSFTSLAHQLVQGESFRQLHAVVES